MTDVESDVADRFREASVDAYVAAKLRMKLVTKERLLRVIESAREVAVSLGIDLDKKNGGQHE